MTFNDNLLYTYHRIGDNMNDIKQIKLFVNDYLTSVGKKSIIDVLKENNRVDDDLELNKHYVISLQQILLDYTKKNGIDLNQEMISSEGRKQVLGLISKTESKYIRTMIDTYFNNIEENKKAVVK